MSKLKGKNVLVTGGAGFIGSHLVDRIILEKPQKIVVIDNLFLGREENLQQAKKKFPNLKFYKQDISHFYPTRNIVVSENIDVVYNLAAIALPASLVNPFWVVTNMVNASNVVCELLRKGYFRTLIHFSSSEVYGTAKYKPMDENHPLNPLTPYAASKVACDHIVLSYHNTFNVDVRIVRPFNNYGPRQNYGKYAGIIPVVIKKIKSHEPVVIYGDGKQTRDYIYVKDVVDAAVKIYECRETRGKIINIGGGKMVSINFLVNKLLSVLNSDERILYEKKRPGDVSEHQADIQLAQKLIGFRPKVGLEEGLKETVNWYEKL